jgi:NADH dehydrogenase [ubiquinone] 1 alpha subcomplex assembly factor 2
VKPIAGPSTTAQLNTKPSFTVPDKRPVEQTGQPSSSPTQASKSKREGLVSDSVPAPGATVDPGKNDDPAELRRLAEEDTKRRIEQRGGEADLRVGNGNVEGVDVGGGGGLAPRRRGKK